MSVDFTKNISRFEVEITITVRRGLTKSEYDAYIEQQESSDSSQNQEDE